MFYLIFLTCSYLLNEILEYPKDMPKDENLNMRNVLVFSQIFVTDFSK